MTTVLAHARTPERSLEQRKTALQRANKIRSSRSSYKRDLRAGRKDLSEVILNPPEWMHTAKIYELLLAVPKIGRVKASKAIAAARVSHSKTVGGLSPRQRHDLVAALNEQIPSRRERARALAA